MEIEKVLSQRVIRTCEVSANGIEYYTGQLSNYPKDGSYLDPESDYKYRFIDMSKWVSSRVINNGLVLDVGGGTGEFWILDSKDTCRLSCASY